MSDQTKIEWADATWNPIVGCSKVSPGCERCYAIRVAHRIGSRVPAYAGLTKTDPLNWTGAVRFRPNVLYDPLRWRKPRRIFVCSESDLFHEKVQDEWLDRIFVVMALAKDHVFQVLTKRPERMRAWLGNGKERILAEMRRVAACNLAGWAAFGPRTYRHESWINRFDEHVGWPLPNVWLGVSCEDQQRWNERVPILLKCPAALHWVSAEPLLGFIKVSRRARGLKWVVIGGESGPGARVCNLNWVRRLVMECLEFGVPCFVKQLGSHPVIPDIAPNSPEAPDLRAALDIDCEWSVVGTRFGNPTGDPKWNGRVAMLKDHKGGDPSEWPEDLRVRRWPSAQPEVGGTAR